MEMENEKIGEEIGHVVDYYAKAGAAGIVLTSGALNVGDKIRIKGHTSDVEQTIESMQIDNQAVNQAKSGDSIGIKVVDRVRKGDKVYKIAP